MNNLRLGIDIGSTTVKVVIINKDTKEYLYSRYERHNARQLETLKRLLNELPQEYKNVDLRAAVCGSGGRPIAMRLGINYIQEVVANSAAIECLYPNVRTAIELGGQDAKVIFFYYDDKQKKLCTSDMRMNGSCAGGTGAFIDEIAKLFNLTEDKFNELASKGTSVYDISGRCGVFAKTDIQPLVIQGARREDIALSTFHAIAKQTIGGLSQGLELKPPIIFEGGPLTFNPTLIKVFAQRLNLTDDEIIIPKHAETIVAFGTAYAIDSLFTNASNDYVTINELIASLSNTSEDDFLTNDMVVPPLFKSNQELIEFNERHDKELGKLKTVEDNIGQLDVYIGIDSGSTTSKFVLIDRDGDVIDRFYANNHGDPLKVVKSGMCDIYTKYKERGVILNPLGLATTGYGEQLLAKALHADFHTVETVAHSAGCTSVYPNATFVLDIGGQDMKAIWLNKGVITNIMLNEACSSGCGSFLENFASNLNIDVSEIADKAFAASNPAHLGSRCTVFMNSTIITEQRKGKTENAIMAGLCRSIIENVFTKVVRISSPDDLGDTVVVQGGTFKNRAVLRSIEEYLGKEVKLAPFPGEMGALGAALLVKEKIEKNGYEKNNKTSFIGFDKLLDFKYDTKTGVRCKGCANGCLRTVLTFPDGSNWITGNRCERGLSLDNDLSSLNKKDTCIDIMTRREEMLFSDYDYKLVREKQNKTVGLPRVLEFYDSMPFWSTFFKSLGYDVVFSAKSGRKLYESGISYVASDTICFPAKLVHGHINNLLKRKVDRIFFPYIMHMPPEARDKLSPYVCSVVQGYPMVVRNQQNPEKDGKVIFDTQVFHWFSKKEREKSIKRYAMEVLNATKSEADEAYIYAKKAILSFRENLYKLGDEAIRQTKEKGKFAVVLAGRPYHTDPFVNKRLSKLFVKKGINVLTVDSLREINDQDLSNTRIEITNNFHTRMLGAAYVCAKHPELEYVQIVSFGCGHDAILSDEIIRILNESARKSPLILKVDESDAIGALRIRVQSFIESVQIRRKLIIEMKKNANADEDIYSLLDNFRKLPSPSEAKFYKKDKKKRTVIVPNVSFEFTKILKCIMEKEGYKVKTVDVGGTKEIGLGKKYVHNDICFPAQMVIGEILNELLKGNYKQSEVAVAMVKFQCDCRMSHYSGLLRKGLDSAGFKDVPIITTDFNDTKKNHPGVFILSPSAILEAIWGFMMLDSIQNIVRKIRPYEINKGETDRIFQEIIDDIALSLKSGIRAAKKAFERGINRLKTIAYDRTNPRNIVYITGELLVTYHSGCNFDIEKYMEKNGMEVMFPRITDQLRKDFLATMEEIKKYNANIFPYPYAVDALFNHVQRKLEEIAMTHPLYEKEINPNELYEGVRDIIPKTLSCGEGWLMAAEINHYAKDNVKNFIILQPFGCLPNHICGRGVIKRLKDDYKDISILPLDLDPDTSFANIENRLQMMIMNAS